MHAVYIVNKHGSMLFQHEFTSRNKSQISVNEKIRFASTFHAISALASELAPSDRQAADLGIESVNFSNQLSIHCKQTLTGMQFILVCVDNVPKKAATDLLNQIYVLYADYVLKNPFYQADLPIRLTGFTRGLKQLVAAFSWFLFLGIIYRSSSDVECMVSSNARADNYC